METLNTLIRFFQEGGIFMYPIAIVLVFGVAITVERWIFLGNARNANRKAFEQVLPLLHKQDYQGILHYAEVSAAPISRIIAAGIARLPHTQRRDEVEFAMEEGVLEAVPRLEKRTQYLATLANLATLFGLLGTVVGLIEAFAAVGNANAAEKSALLSASIAVAMNCTAFGLIAAIPMLLVHAVLQTKTAEIVDSLEMAGVKSLNILTAKKMLGSQTRASD
jgi:biopolymer transport protein ExbB/TolQ